MKAIQLAQRIGVRFGWLCWLPMSRRKQRRNKARRIAQRIDAAEPRILLSGATADVLNLKNVSAEAKIDVTLNDEAGAVITSVSTTSNGTVRLINEAGHQYVGYTPNAGYSGVDTFTYTIAGSTSSSGFGTPGGYSMPSGYGSMSGSGGTTSPSDRTASVTVNVQSASLPKYREDATNSIYQFTTLSGFDTYTASGDRSTVGVYSVDKTGSYVTISNASGVTETWNTNWTLHIVSSNSSYSESYTATTSIVVSGGGAVGSGIDVFSYTLTSAGATYSLIASMNHSVESDRTLTTSPTDSNTQTAASGGTTTSAPSSTTTSGLWGIKERKSFNLSQSSNGTVSTFAASGKTSLDVFTKNVTYTTTLASGSTHGTLSQSTSVASEYAISRTVTSTASGSGYGATTTENNGGWIRDTVDYNRSMIGSGSMGLSIGGAQMTAAVTETNSALLSTWQSSNLTRQQSGNWVGVTGAGSGSTTTNSTFTVEGTGGFTSGTATATTTTAVAGSVTVVKSSSNGAHAEWAEQMGADGEFYTISGSGSGDGGSHTSVTLNGTGTFSITGGGTQVGGTLGQYSQLVVDSHAHVDTRVLSGVWLTKGTGSDSATVTTSNWYSGSGTFSSPPPAAPLSGTLHMSGSDSVTVHTERKLEIREQDVDWSVTSGWGTGHASGFAAMDYSGSGTTTQAGGPSQVSATGGGTGTAGNAINSPTVWDIKVSGNSRKDYVIDWGVSYSGSSIENGTWNTSSGSGFATQHTFDKVEFTGGRNTSINSGGWNITGRTTASGDQTTTTDSRVDLSVVSGKWNYTGNGTTGSIRNSDVTTIASGDYDSNIPSSPGSPPSGGTTTSAPADPTHVTAHMTFNGRDTTHDESGLVLQLVPATQGGTNGDPLSAPGTDASWEITSGTGSGTTAGSTTTLIDGSFTYISSSSNPSFSGSGTFGNVDRTGYSANYSANYLTAGSTWDLTAGSGSTDASGNGWSHFSGSGTYSSNTPEMTFSAGFKVKQDSSNRYDFHESLGINSSDQWISTFGRGTTDVDSSEKTSYSGGGALTPGGGIAGGFSASGDSNTGNNRHVSLDFDVAQQKWNQTNGNGHTDFDNNDYTSWNMAGSITNNDSSGGNNTTITATVTVIGSTYTHVFGSHDESLHGTDPTSEKTWELDSGHSEGIDGTNQLTTMILGGTVSAGGFSGLITGNSTTTDRSNFHTFSDYDTASKRWHTNGGGTVDSDTITHMGMIGSMPINEPLTGGQLTGRVGVTTISDSDSHLRMSYSFIEATNSAGGNNWRRVTSHSYGGDTQTTTTTINAGGGFTTPIGNGSLTGNVTVIGFMLDHTESSWGYDQLSVTGGSNEDVSNQQWTQTSGHNASSGRSNMTVGTLGSGFSTVNESGFNGVITILFSDLIGTESHYHSDSWFSNGGWTGTAGGDSRYTDYSDMYFGGGGGFSASAGPVSVSGTWLLIAGDTKILDYSTGWSQTNGGAISQWGGGTGFVQKTSLMSASGSGGYTISSSGSQGSGGSSPEEYSYTKNGVVTVNMLEKDSSIQTWSDAYSNNTWLLANQGLITSHESSFGTTNSYTGTYHRSRAGEFDIRGTLEGGGSLSQSSKTNWGGSQIGTTPWQFSATNEFSFKQTSSDSSSGSGTAPAVVLGVTVPGTAGEGNEQTYSYEASGKMIYTNMGVVTRYGGGQGLVSQSAYRWTQGSIGYNQLWGNQDRTNYAAFTTTETRRVDVSSSTEWTDDLQNDGSFVTHHYTDKNELKNTTVVEIDYSGTYIRHFYDTDHEFGVDATGVISGHSKMSEIQSSSSTVDHDYRYLNIAPLADGTGGYTGYGWRVVSNYTSRTVTDTLKFESFQSTAGTYNRIHRDSVVDVYVGGLFWESDNTYEHSKIISSYSVGGNSETRDTWTKSLYSEDTLINPRPEDVYLYSYDGGGTGSKSWNDGYQHNYSLTIKEDAKGYTQHSDHITEYKEYVNGVADSKNHDRKGDPKNAGDFVYNYKVTEHIQVYGSVTTYAGSSYSTNLILSDTTTETISKDNGKFYSVTYSGATFTFKVTWTPDKDEWEVHLYTLDQSYTRTRVSNASGGEGTIETSRYNNSSTGRIWGFNYINNSSSSNQNPDPRAGTAVAFDSGPLFGSSSATGSKGTSSFPVPESPAWRFVGSDTGNPLLGSPVLPTTRKYVGSDTQRAEGSQGQSQGLRDMAKYVSLPSSNNSGGVTGNGNSNNYLTGDGGNGGGNNSGTAPNNVPPDDAATAREEVDVFNAENPGVGGLSDIDALDVFDTFIDRLKEKNIELNDFEAAVIESAPEFFAEYLQRNGDQSFMDLMTLLQSGMRIEFGGFWDNASHSALEEVFQIEEFLPVAEQATLLGKEVGRLMDRINSQVDLHNEKVYTAGDFTYVGQDLAMAEFSSKYLGRSLHGAKLRAYLVLRFLDGAYWLAEKGAEHGGNKVVSQVVNGVAVIAGGAVIWVNRANKTKKAIRTSGWSLSSWAGKIENSGRHAKDELIALAKKLKVSIHGHHIVMKGLWLLNKDIRVAVKASRAILKRSGIGVNDLKNLCFALNTKAQHSVDYARKVLARLQAAETKAIIAAKKNNTKLKDEMEKHISKALKEMTEIIEAGGSL